MNINGRFMFRVWYSLIKFEKYWPLRQRRRTYDSQDVVRFHFSEGCSVVRDYANCSLNTSGEQGLHTLALKGYYTVLITSVAVFGSMTCLAELFYFYGLSRLYIKKLCHLLSFADPREGLDRQLKKCVKQE